MLLLSHPTGNCFVRALLETLETAQIDYFFHTTLALNPASWWRRFLPPTLNKEIARRTFNIPSARCKQRPARELSRLLYSRLASPSAALSSTHPLSINAVYQDLDHQVASVIRQNPHQIQTLYAYEDGAAESFAVARSFDIQCVYDLPILHWETSRLLLQEEADRWPEWKPTLLAPDEPQAKLDRKTRELELADLVVCPSDLVYRSLPHHIRATKECLVAEFGSPPSAPLPLLTRESPDRNRPLRVLFAGTLTQRKGLADLFAAMQLLDRTDLELILLGTPLLPLDFYRRHYPHFTYQPVRPHSDLLAFMRTCDLLVLPSIVEGRALVQQEALSCGLPLIITPNTGGEDLVDPGQTGFLVPIRDPHAIAEKIEWFADHRSALPDMREQAQLKASRFTWPHYGAKILERIASLRETTSLQEA